MTGVRPRESVHARATGAAMVAAAAASVLLMAHHPSGFHGAVELGRIVHGGMMVVVILFFVGYLRLSQQLGLDDVIVQAALVAFGVGAVANLGAATINGMIVPALAARGDAAVARDVFLFAWEANQALAHIGVVATGAAYAGWSLRLFAQAGADRLIAALGLAAGLGPIAALWLGGYGMELRTAFAIYAAHALFTAAVGVRLWRHAPGPRGAA